MFSRTGDKRIRKGCKYPVTKVNRKKITDLLLREQLALDEDWGQLPKQLPSFVHPLLGPEIASLLEKKLRKLMDAGCHRKVLWFCLGQLDPSAAKDRLGRTCVAIRKDRKTGQKRESYVIPASRKIATREDLKPLANACRNAFTQIHRYTDELGLVARALEREHPVPRPLVELADQTTSSMDPVTALLHTRYLLGWVENLSQDWATPEENKVLKAKEPLYLGIYVEYITRGRRKVRKDCEEIVETILSYFSPDLTSIRKKIGNFRDRYPQTYKKLYSNLRDLHLRLQPTKSASSAHKPI
jgi:hypothetical protein